MFLLGAIPQLLFNIPVIAIAGKLAVIEQQKALKASSGVKLAARDVLMSYKIIYAMVCIPSLYVFYSFVLAFVFKWTWTSIILWDLAAPGFAFLGAKASEQGVRNWKSLAPLLKRAS